MDGISVGLFLLLISAWPAGVEGQTWERGRAHFNFYCCSMIDMAENGFHSAVNGMMASDDGDNSMASAADSADESVVRESEEARRQRKEREREERRAARRNETEEERRIRKEKEKEHRRRTETEEERRIRKEREREERRRSETEEERRARKEREREERKRNETEEERRARKERERMERDERRRREGKHVETEEERRIRKEKERQMKMNETEEERRARKERERRERKEREMLQQRQEEEENSMDIKEEEDNSMDIKEESMDNSPPNEDDFEEVGRRSKKRKSYREEEDEDYEDANNHAHEEDEDDFVAQKRRSSTNKKAKKVKRIKEEEEEERDEEDFKPIPKKKTTRVQKKEPPSSTTSSPTKGGRKVKKEEGEVWKWWEEEKKSDGTKWSFLQHRGPLFAPDYDPLPPGVNFKYGGKIVKLEPEAEEVATFYGRMLDHDYTSKEVFNTNFFKDWRKVMTTEERALVKDLSKCDFSEINEHFKRVSEARKNRSKEEKQQEKEKNEAITLEYGFCMIDGHKEKIGNFRIEPPGLFRGRGEHPKQGMLKKRVQPEDVIINCSKNSEIPQPPKGHKWKKVQHDNTVTWLASWTENIQNQIKYVMLNPSSKLKGEKDMLKYEKARELKKHIKKIRKDYEADFKSKEMRIRQRAVALYFIDKLALRAGNEKDEDQADTVGCCSLRVEHIKLRIDDQDPNDKDKRKYYVEFDFLGKDSIRYLNEVEVVKDVYKNVKIFMDNKKTGDDLFDRLNTSTLNEYLNGLMSGLTAKVFRTYNASITLQEQLEKLTEADDNVVAKMLSYNRANRAVAVLCNHQRAVPKTHDKSMANLQAKIDAKNDVVAKAEKEYKDAKRAHKNGKNAGSKALLDKKTKALERAREQLDKLKTQAVDKEENKTIALGTSKLNYLDPRISVAWCKKNDVPIEKVYNKTQREKFRWAIEMTEEDYLF